MMTNSDFIVLILAYGRPHSMMTIDTLRKSGYTGELRVVIGKDDPEREEYQRVFGDILCEYDKADVRLDPGDNTGDIKSSCYARNACFDIAKDLGVTYFIVLDDDYLAFTHKRNHRHQYEGAKPIKDMDEIFDAMLDFYKGIPALTIAMSQTGDYMGGIKGTSWKQVKRKAMNSFVCSTERRFPFLGRLNEDVTTYVRLGEQGFLFLQLPRICLQQKPTATMAGGLTEVYKQGGTYVKSFYTIMYSPSCVKISVMGYSKPRIHHKVRWRNTVPMIMREETRKAA